MRELGRRRANRTTPPVHLSESGARPGKNKMKQSIIVIAAICAVAVLAGCRQEQDHPLVTGNGNYTGPAPEELTPAQVNALGNRIALQGTASESGGAAVRPKEERPAPPPSTALDKRLQEQAGPMTPKAQSETNAPKTQAATNMPKEKAGTTTESKEQAGATATMPKAPAAPAAPKTPAGN
jgi:hypothetical protein